MAAPKTVKTVALDGSTKDFEIPFEYLARKFVKVTLIGLDRKPLVLNQDFRFSTRTVLTTMKAWGPADGYEAIEIRRETSATERLVDFSDGSILRAYDLNTAQIQSLHIAEEGRDIATDTIGVDNNGNLDARGRRIVNLADAIEPGDAVSLRQLQSYDGSALNSANKAAASAAAALASEGKAKTSETNAKASESASKASELKAKDWATKPEDQPVEAGLYSSYHYSRKASASETNAKTSETNAKTSEANAKTSETNAKTSENSAKDSEVSAAESAAAAENARADVESAGLQLGMSMVGYRLRPFAGFALDDGQELDRAAFPDFAAALDAGIFPTTTEALWQMDPTKRGCFVANSSPGKFRMRDLNGAMPDSLGGMFQRGSTDVTPVIHRDQMQNITGQFEGRRLSAGEPQLLADTNTGAFGQNLAAGAARPRNTASVGAALSADIINFDASRVARTGDETYGMHVTMAYMTRLFGEATPLGTAEANALATSYAALASRVSILESVKGPRDFSFHGTLYTSANTGVNGTIIVRVSPTLNRGGAYNVETGRFTAQMAGLYEFTGTCNRGTDAGSVTQSPQISLRVNGAQRALALAYNNTYISGSVSLITELQAGDYVELAFTSTNGANTQLHSAVFNGKMLQSL